LQRTIATEAGINHLHRHIDVETAVNRIVCLILRLIHRP